MSEEEITALAREYAEEKASIMQGSLGTKIQAELVIRFLLRRFALVEKGKVNEMYKTAMEVSSLPKSVEARGYAISRLQTLESLFPEIAKEVKG